MDISENMLQTGKKSGKQTQGDSLVRDMGDGLCFRKEVFQGVISISVLQWLCTGASPEIVQKRITKFFRTLHRTLTPTGRAVFQFYPETTQQIKMLLSEATKLGLNGGVIIDYPNLLKAKKYFLLLFKGKLPPSLDLSREQKKKKKELETQQFLDTLKDDEDDQPTKKKRKFSSSTKKNKRKRTPIKNKDWKLNKKSRLSYNKTKSHSSKRTTKSKKQ